MSAVLNSDDIAAAGGALLGRHTNVSGDNVWLVEAKPASAPTGWSNLAIGDGALGLVTDGYLNTVVGNEAGMSAVGMRNTTLIGARAGMSGVGGASPNHLADCVYIGALTGRDVTKGVGDTGVGYRALGRAIEAGHNVGVGDSALWLNTGTGAVAVGYTAAESVADADFGVFIGEEAASFRSNAERCIYIGKGAGSIVSNKPNVDISAGTGAVPAGVDNVGIGYYSLIECLGSRMTAVGTGSGQSMVGSVGVNYGSTFLGFYAGNHASQKVDAVNSMALGQQTYTTANHQVVIGNASTIDVLIGMGGAATRLAVGTTSPTSTAHINGSLATGIRTITATATAAATDHTILCDATSGAITLNLPAAAGCSGRTYVVKKIDATNNVTIDANSSETIDGAETKVLSTQWETVRIKSNGTAWFTV